MGEYCKEIDQPYDIQLLAFMWDAFETAMAVLFVIGLVFAVIVIVLTLLIVVLVMWEYLVSDRWNRIHEKDDLARRKREAAEEAAISSPEIAGNVPESE